MAFLYPVVQCFAAVYTANHYVVDLLIGFVYATASLYGVRWFWRRRGLAGVTAASARLPLSPDRLGGQPDRASTC